MASVTSRPTALAPFPVETLTPPSPRRRVLMVSPHFPPVNAPDHQRIRTMLPYLAEFGWEAEILMVSPAEANHGQDTLLQQVLPESLTIHQTTAIPRQITRLVGLGHLGWRCLPAMARAGNRLLSQKSFDLVFFSTTIFPVMTLGPYWHRRFGVPFMVDFQDPWRVDAAPAGQHRPGGRLKYALDKSLAAICEPRVMKRVSQVVSVSPTYPKTLQTRYPWLRPEQFTVLPFGAPEADFQQLPHLPVQQTHFTPGSGRKNWVYVGRGGPDMKLALQGLFLALRELRSHHPKLADQLHLHFIGTSYAPAGRATKSVEPIAAACGVADLVTEQTQRVPYFEAQKLLTDSDAVLLIGSADPKYTASKLYPAVLAKKPILAIFHEASSVVDILQKTRSGHIVTFNEHCSAAHLCHQLGPYLQTLLSWPRYTAPPTDWDAFAPYTAAAMTQALCQVFDRCLRASTEVDPPKPEKHP